MHDCWAEGYVYFCQCPLSAAVTYVCRCFRSQESVSMDSRKGLKYGVKRKVPPVCQHNQPTLAILLEQESCLREEKRGHLSPPDMVWPSHTLAQVRSCSISNPILLSGKQHSLQYKHSQLCWNLVADIWEACYLFGCLDAAYPNTLSHWDRPREGDGPCRPQGHVLWR